MISKQIYFFLFLFNTISSEFINKNKLSYSPLFYQENVCKVRKIFYQNEKQDSNLIILSDDSISSVNLSKKEINYRKKINQHSEIVSLESKNFFVTQPKSTSVEVFRTETGQYVNSLELIDENNLLYNVKTLKI